MCPYNDVTSGCLSVRTGENVTLAWTYQGPLPAAAAIATMIAIYNEKLDIIIDVIDLSRPATRFG